MKKIGLTVCLALGISAYAKTDIGSISSSIPVTSYIVKEVGSSEMLMAKNKDARIEPASLTKILTSIIAIESGRLSETVTIPREATLVEPSKAGFRPGDKISLLDLVKAAVNIGVIKFDARDDAGRRAIMQEFRHFVEIRRVVFVPFHDEKISVADAVSLAEIFHHAAD